MIRKMYTRLSVAALLSALVLLAAACSSEQLKAADVFTKSLEATGKLSGFSTEMTMKQQMEQSGQKMDTDSKINMDLNMKPDKAFKMNMAISAMGQNMNMQMYYTKDGMFVQDPTSGEWMKMPSDQLDQVMKGASEEQLDPAKQLEKLKPFAEDFKMTDDKESYTLELNATGDKFNEFLKNEAKQSLGGSGMGEELDDTLSGLKISNVEYTYTIDKKTYYPKKINIVMDMEMEIEGQKLTMKQQIDGTYSNFDAVKEITVPADVLEKAQTAE